MPDLYASSLVHDLATLVFMVAGVPALIRLVFWGVNRA